MGFWDESGRGIGNASIGMWLASMVTKIAVMQALEESAEDLRQEFQNAEWALISPMACNRYVTHRAKLCLIEVYELQRQGNDADSANDRS